jgi:hypothetical protein
MNRDVEMTKLIETIRELHQGEDNLPSSLALEALDKAMVQLGLGQLVGAYLQSNFGVQRIAEVDDAHLNQALQFMLELQRLLPRRSGYLPPGAVIDGEIIVIHGRIETASDGDRAA